MSSRPKDLNMDVKGFWHRPFEKNIDEVRETLNNISALGFNHLFVETFFNGKLIFKSEKTKLKTHDFVFDSPYGKNLLNAFIEEGKQLGIKIHAWVENFFIGIYQDINTLDSSFKLSWILKNRDETYLQKQEKNYVFLDPAHDEVRKLLMYIYEEITVLDDLESLHLDYIRYPLCYDLDHKTLTDDTGYTDIAVKKFESLHHITHMKQIISSNIKVYDLWKEFKKNQVTSFIKEIHEMIHHRTKISTAVFGNPEHAIANKMQDWLSWVHLGYIDIVMPMAYYKDDQRVYEEISRMRELVGNRVKVVAGLAPSYIGLDPQANLTQIERVKQAQADGVCLFATQNYLIKHFMGVSEKNRIYKDIFASI